MKALVVGYGSIGERHSGILRDMGHTVAVVSRRPIEFDVRYETLAQAVGEFGPDYVVIASRSSEHAEDVNKLRDMKYTGKVIVEKPLYHVPQRLTDHSFDGAYVAYNLRFHPAVTRFRELLQVGEAVSAHVYVGQYLPDWRPSMDYRTSHSAHRAEGGGALRELSHELDYINWIFGGWRQLSALGGQLSRLEIDSDDVFSLLIETERCPLVSLTVNYLDRTLRREAIVHTNTDTIRIDLANATIEHDGRTEKFNVGRNDTYLAEHRAALSGDNGQLCSFGEGADVVDMIAAAERAAVEKCWVSNAGIRAN